MQRRNYLNHHSPFETTDYWHFRCVNRWVFFRPSFFFFVAFSFPFEHQSLKLYVCNRFDLTLSAFDWALSTHSTKVVYAYVVLKKGNEWVSQGSRMLPEKYIFCWRFMNMIPFFIHFHSFRFNIDIYFIRMDWITNEIVKYPVNYTRISI